MNHRKYQRALILTIITLLVSSIISPSSLAVTQAAPNAPQYYGTLSPTVAYPDTYRVTLTIGGLGGVAPPSSQWYDPTGGQVSAACQGGQVIREYEYSYGSLYEVRDYFYISSCNRDPGQYNVIVGWEIDKTFTIKVNTYYIYLPFLNKPPAEPQPPSGFGKLNPADGAAEQFYDISLDWEDSSEADAYEYCYDTSDDDACSNWVDTGASSGASITGLESETTYYWQARAKNSLGTTYANGDSTAYWSFTTRSEGQIPSEMILIPAGEFQMGCDPAHNDGYSCWNSELPLHTVDLDAFWIDKHEVTNAQYFQCAAAGACSPPSDDSSFTRSSYYGNPDYDDYPVIFVTWQDAYDYCAWAGKRLPTEAEWEKAARGASPWAYPWGDESPTCSLANFSASFSNQCVGDTSPVGDYPDGASPYGVLDMAGNVQEMVNDWYDAEYYQTSPTSNPTGPVSGTNRVVRGGGYGNMDEDILSSNRSYDDRAHDAGSDHLGFRCASDTSP
jgi:formylglycine-generating enzyme required for sulfatase activity